jgi:5-deoxy-glucuronate isomerase
MEVAGERAELEGGRQDVFEAPGWPALAGPGSVVRLEGPSLGAVVAWRRWDRPLQPRLLAPGQVAEEQRGSGPARRLVRTYLATGPLMAGETINEPGGWSSFPPHRHEHEEVYLYRFSPPHGFGASLVYEGPGGPVDAAMVRDGSFQRIVSGYHPVVAAPGYRMYYLWVLAGASQTLSASLDPDHAERAG